MARDKPSFEDSTLAGRHGLWVSPSGSLYDLHRPAVRSQLARGNVAPTVPLWLVFSGTHPTFRVSRSSFWSIYQEVDADTGPVLLAWYSHTTVVSTPVWLMLRPVANGDSDEFFYSVWTEGFWKDNRRPSRKIAPPEESIVRGADLDDIEGFGDAAFSGLHVSFRRAWRFGWDTPRQIRRRVALKDADPSLTDLVDGAIRSGAGLAANVAEDAAKLAPAVLNAAALGTALLAGGAYWWFIGRK